MKILEKIETITHIVEYKNNTYELHDGIWIDSNKELVKFDLEIELDEEFKFLKETEKHTNYMAIWWMNKSWWATNHLSSYSKEDFYEEYKEYYVWAKEYFKRTEINHFLKLGEGIEHPFELI